MRKVKVVQTSTNPCLCPRCLAVLDRAANCFGHAPSNGAFTICVKCLHVLVFTKDTDSGRLVLRVPTYSELINMPEELKTDMKLHYLLLCRVREAEKLKQAEAKKKKS